jgi:fucose 4-O-acetylase-like acetyltransferase
VERVERQGFIDQLKAISIFFIVYGHNDYDSVFAQYLTTIRLPLFFVVSGYLSKDKINITISELLGKLTRRLLIPYFLISLFLYSIWLFVERPYFQEPTEYDPIKNFLGIFYAQGGKEFMVWGIPMWYLPALFSISMIDFFVSRLPFNYRIIPTLLLPVVGITIYKALGYHLPWSLDNAMVVYLFYFFGTYIRRTNFLEYIKGKEVWLLLILIPIFIVGASYNKPINYYNGAYNNIVLMFFNGLIGVLWLFTFFSILPTYNKVTWVGKNTLPILAFHVLAMSFIHAVIYVGFGRHLEFSVLMSFFYTVLQILILVPVILFLNRYLPILVGRSKPKIDSVTA